MAKFILVLNMNRIPVFVTPYLCGFYPDFKKKFVGYPAIFLIADKKDKNKKPYYVKAVSLKPKQMCRIFSLKKNPHSIITLVFFMIFKVRILTTAKLN